MGTKQVLPHVKMDDVEALHRSISNIEARNKAACQLIGRHSNVVRLNPNKNESYVCCARCGAPRAYYKDVCVIVGENNRANRDKFRAMKWPDKIYVTSNPFDIGRNP